jgi:hypothetical protein
MDELLQYMGFAYTVEGGIQAIREDIKFSEFAYINNFRVTLKLKRENSYDRWWEVIWISDLTYLGHK